MPARRGRLAKINKKGPCPQPAPPRVRTGCTRMGWVVGGENRPRRCTALAIDSPMRTIRLATPADAAPCLAIYRPVVEETIVSFETTVPAAEAFAARVAATLETHPWLVCEVDGAIAAYACAGPHRTREAYQWCAEVSLYVGEEYRRTGLGRALYTRLIASRKRA